MTAGMTHAANCASVHDCDYVYCTGECNCHVKVIRELESALRDAQALALALETCHQCKGLVIVQDTPVHCEDCSYDCEDHEPPDCTPIDVLHRKLSRSLEDYFDKKGAAK